MKVLVTGGAGYIGSITSHELAKSGHEVAVYDSLVHGHEWAVQGLELIVGETQDKDFLLKILKERQIEAVIHFAAFIEVAESMRDPYQYFQNNVYGTLQLLAAMREVGVNKFIFSSSAGVYGNPQRLPIKEDDNKEPTNPYGETKVMVEKILSWFEKIHQVHSISLRYFNAAGATLDGKLGEAHDPESHLIPNLLKAALTDKPVTIFGNDYPTLDGTCVRDYIHVLDLAKAHIMALAALNKTPKSTVYNVGTGKGYSNKQVLAMIEKVIGKPLKANYASRRPGDAAELVADSAKLQTELGWRPQYSDLETIVKTAFSWHKQSYEWR